MRSGDPNQPPSRNRRRPRRLGVFALGPTSAQVTWAALGPGPVRFRAGDLTCEVDADGGPGSVVLEPLPPASRVTVHVDGPGVRGAPRRLAVTTLAAPAGDELCRIATISDLHVGEQGFGYWHRIREPETVTPPYPLRCSEAAIDEAAAWGAGLLVVKGDITNKGLTDEWRDVEPALRNAPLPLIAVPGNHDVRATAQVDARQRLSHQGIAVADPIAVHDVAGTRIVVLDTTVRGLHAGRVGDVEDELLSALADAARDGRGALVAMHHQLQTRFVPAHWPPGVPIGASRRLLRAIAGANPRTLVTSGHTHRHRRHRLGPVTTTTVGSVKDYPGVWAGYAVHEGGIRQEVRRVARPDVIRWTEHSGRALAGAYRCWTPGTLASRCFTLDWSAR